MPIPRFQLIRSPTRLPRAGVCLRWGQPRPTILSVSGQASGLYRTTDATLARYEIFRGVDGAAIDYSTPWQTTAAIPVIYAAPANSHRYEFVVRKRNAWGLSSQNVASLILDLDGSGNERTVPPSGPRLVTLEGAPGASYTVRASYLYTADGDDAADTWVVYVRSDGTDPNPAIDTPAFTETMGKSDSVARLDLTDGPYSEGADVRAIVRTRRSGTPDVDSTNTDVHTIVTTYIGPAAPTGGAFVGDIAEQAQ